MAVHVSIVSITSMALLLLLVMAGNEWAGYQAHSMSHMGGTRIHRRPRIREYGARILPQTPCILGVPVARPDPRSRSSVSAPHRCDGRGMESRDDRLLQFAMEWWIGAHQYGCTTSRRIAWTRRQNGRKTSRCRGGCGEYRHS